MVSLAVCLTAALAALIADPSDAFAPQTSIFRSHRDASGKLSMIDPAAHVDLIHSTASLLPSLSLSDAVLETAATASSAVDAVSQSGIDTPDLASAASSMPNAGGVGYSKASYYTTLGLYVMSFPGIWSQIKRSTSAKVKRKTYVSDGEAASDGKDLRQQAGEIMAYMKANNYEVLEAGETITFRGLVQKSLSQALFLTFCTALGMASLALVLQIQFQDLSKCTMGWLWCRMHGHCMYWPSRYILIIHNNLFCCIPIYFYSSPWHRIAKLVLLDSARTVRWPLLLEIG